jgi:hypothetical protein
MRARINDASPQGEPKKLGQSEELWNVTSGLVPEAGKVG